MKNYDSSTMGQPVECGICSNGPNKVYHIGGPCPYLYGRRLGDVDLFASPPPKFCPHCGEKL